MPATLQILLFSNLTVKVEVFKKERIIAMEKLYGYKLEVSVIPSGFAVVCSSHYPGSTSDLTIFRRTKNGTKRSYKKGKREQ